MIKNVYKPSGKQGMVPNETAVQLFKSNVKNVC
jgi:hypothetical protein